MATFDERGDAAALEAILAEILVDAHGDSEQLWAFRQAFEDNVPFPAEAFVIDAPVSVVEIDFDGNERRGLTATCIRVGYGKHVVALADVRFRAGSEGVRYAAVYRKWLGLEPLPDRRIEDPRISRRKKPPPEHRPEGSRGSRRKKAAAADLALGASVELIVLSVKKASARCRIPGSNSQVTLRARVWDAIPGEILTVRTRKQWRHAGHAYVSGDIETSRCDVAALALTPLRLDRRDLWDPAKHYWGEEGEPLEEWAKPIAQRGPRPQFEMEQVLRDADIDDPFEDPILDASDLQAGGDPESAREILMGLLRADLRCLDAHAHLGNFVFDHTPKEAIRHYEVGVGIGELSLGPDFDGVLPWGFIDNRPFLRCLHGLGLCLWQLGRSVEASALFERMLWLNPADNQGIRSLLGPARDGETYEEF